jgi:hypothetical protein
MHRKKNEHPAFFFSLVKNLSSPITNLILGCNRSRRYQLQCTQIRYGEKNNTADAHRQLKAKGPMDELDYTRLGQHRKRMTMHEISSLLILPRASDVNRFAAVCGSLVDFTRSTASWFFITFTENTARRVNINKEKINN